MVTTRRQAAATTLRNRKGIERTARQVKSTRPNRTVVQKRRQADAIANQPRHTPVQFNRQSLSLAPPLGNHILFLFVGEPLQLITLHSELLPVETKAYIHEKSQNQQVYQLPEEDVTIAQIYRLYLYTNEVFSIGETDQDRPDNGRREAHGDAEWTKLAHCYLFGITVRDERFANACITAIIEKMLQVDRYPTGIASEVYQFTDAGDQLRKLIVNVHVFKGLGQWLRPPHDDANGPREFMQDVVNGLAAAGDKIYSGEVKMPWEQGVCTYHTHAMTERC